jgi:uncharacterized integral membrane protein
MVVFILLTLLLLAVAVFALQNPDPVTLRFLGWQTQSSVAIVALGATATGALIAGLLALAGRLRRWQRGRGPGPAVAPGRQPALPPEAPPGGPPPRPGAGA